jgi:hypothetical protein
MSSRVTLLSLSGVEAAAGRSLCLGKSMETTRSLVLPTLSGRASAAVACCGVVGASESLLLLLLGDEFPMLPNRIIMNDVEVCITTPLVDFDKTNFRSFCFEMSHLGLLLDWPAILKNEKCISLASDQNSPSKHSFVVLC